MMRKEEYYKQKSSKLKDPEMGIGLVFLSYAVKVSVAGVR